MKPKKHKRNNRERWDKAWSMVQFWYSQLAREGAVTYTVGGQKVSVAIAEDGGIRDTLAAAKQDRPENWRTRRDKAGVEVVTANGKERRYIFADEAQRPFQGDYIRTPIAERDGPRVRSTNELEPPIKRAREVMQMVAKLSPDARRVLEMRAATWDFPHIADEIGCAEHTARSYFSEGMGIVMCWQASWRDIVDRSTYYNSENLVSD